MTEQEKQQALSEGKTQGKRGCKLPRIHMAFTPENIDYIEVMSRLNGTTKGAFVNDLLNQHREDNGEIYQKAKNLITSMSKGKGDG
ncbi:MAG: hypothetical protein R3Y63_14135 [Eubacteriales bacterium]